MNTPDRIPRRRLARAILMIAAAAPIACTKAATTPMPPPPPPIARGTAAPPPAGSLVKDVVDEEGRHVLIQEGPAGDPAVVGCADGQREGFIDAGRFPAVAGCLASWAGALGMRSARTGEVCGDDRGPCRAPADACAPGWHLCGAGGSVSEVRALGADDCEHASAGRFSTAISHCLTQDGCALDAAPDARYECFESGWCSEPVCCGEACGEFGRCRDGVWPEHTHIAVGMDQGCGAQTSRRAGGVLCCR